MATILTSQSLQRDFADPAGRTIGCRTCCRSATAKRPAC